MKFRNKTALSALLLCALLAGCSPEAFVPGTEEENGIQPETAVQTEETPAESGTEVFQSETAAEPTEKETLAMTKLDTDGTSWKAPLQQNLNSLGDASCQYAVVYIDDDDSPEILVHRSEPEPGFNDLYTAGTEYNGFVMRFDDGPGIRFGGYSERENLFWTSEGSGDGWGSTFYRLDNGIPVQLDSFLAVSDGISMHFYINDTEVSESEFQLKYDAYPHDSSSDFSFVSYSEFRKQMAKLLPAQEGSGSSFSDILAITGSSVEGFLCDLDLDGIEEMILMSDAESSFTLYRYNSSGSVEEYQFGNFTSSAGVRAFEVTGTDGSHCLYWRDEEMHFSKQGYFDVVHDNALDISIGYPNVGYCYWDIYNNGTLVSSGEEEVDGVYAQPDQCHAALLDAFGACGFPVVENSNYSKLTCLSYYELLNSVQ